MSCQPLLVVGTLFGSRCSFDTQQEGAKFFDLSTHVTVFSPFQVSGFATRWGSDTTSLDPFIVDACTSYQANMLPGNLICLTVRSTPDIC